MWPFSFTFSLFLKIKGQIIVGGFEQIDCKTKPFEHTNNGSFLNLWFGGALEKMKVFSKPISSLGRIDKFLPPLMREMVVWWDFVCQVGDKERE